MPAPLEIEVTHLSFSYPDGTQALQDVSFQIAAGEKVALVGPNGAGKSTLLLHLNGLLRGNGHVRIDGQEITANSLRSIRGKVGFVFQQPDDQLFSPTVFDDVAYGPIYQGLGDEDVRHRVHEALSAVHMEGYAQRASHHLSAGEKKRIALATVLSMRPQILVLDEPTSGLAPAARRALIELLEELPQTIIAATHDLAMVREILPRTLVMDAGCIVADGETQDNLSNESLLRAHGMEGF